MHHYRYTRNSSSTKGIFTVAHNTTRSLITYGTENQQSNLTRIIAHCFVTKSPMCVALSVKKFPLE